MNKFLVSMVVLVAAQAGWAKADAPVQALQANGRNWGDLGLKANVNQYIDETISMVVPFIVEQGLDPMPLPNIREGFEVRPLWVRYSAWLDLYNGQLTGLVNVARSGDQNVHYFANMLRLRLQFEFTDLEFQYRYSTKVMNIGPRGRIAGSLNRFVVVVDVLLDFNNDELHLQEFSLREIGRLRVKILGNFLVNWFVNPVVSLFTRIFDNTLMNVVQNNIRSAIQNALYSLNNNIRETVQRLESYGQNLPSY